MRVTQRQIQGFALSALSGARGRVFELQQRAASGLRVERPSDDPAAAARARVLGSLISENRTYRQATAHALARLQTAEAGLSQASNIMARAKEIALAMASGTVSAEQRATAATEVYQLRAQMIEIVNSKYDDEYVFANTATDSPPLDGAGNFTYDPNVYDSVLAAELGEQQRAEIGASAAHAFAVRAAAPGSVDVVDELDLLGQALNANDPDAVRAQIVTLDAGSSQIISERARTGLRIQGVQLAEQRATEQLNLFERLRSDVVDADAAETFSQLSLAQTTLQAAIGVAGRVLGPSLLDAL